MKIGNIIVKIFQIYEYNLKKKTKPKKQQQQSPHVDGNTFFKMCSTSYFLLNTGGAQHNEVLNPLPEIYNFSPKDASYRKELTLLAPHLYQIPIPGIMKLPILVDICT